MNVTDNIEKQHDFKEPPEVYMDEEIINLGNYSLFKYLLDISTCSPPVGLVAYRLWTDIRTSDLLSFSHLAFSEPPSRTTMINNPCASMEVKDVEVFGVESLSQLFPAGVSRKLVPRGAINPGIPEHERRSSWSVTSSLVTSSSFKRGRKAQI
jgi:hypothetical protein